MYVTARLQRPFGAQARTCARPVPHSEAAVPLSYQWRLALCLAESQRPAPLPAPSRRPRRDRAAPSSLPNALGQKRSSCGCYHRHSAHPRGSCPPSYTIPGDGGGCESRTLDHNRRWPCLSWLSCSVSQAIFAQLPALCTPKPAARFTCRSSQRSTRAFLWPMQQAQRCRRRCTSAAGAGTCRGECRLWRSCEWRWPCAWPSRFPSLTGSRPPRRRSCGTCCSAGTASIC